MLFVKRMVVDHKLLLIGPSSGGLQGYFQGVFWYYLLAIPFILGRGNPAIITLFVAIVSTLSILLTFFVLKKIGGIFTGFIGAVIYAFVTFSIASSYFPWNPYPIVWLMPLYVYALYAFTEKKAFALPLAGLLTALFMHFEIIYGITLIPTFIILVILELKRNKWHMQAKHALTTTIALLIPFLPTLLFDLRHHFLITTTLVKTVITGGGNITHGAFETPLPFDQRLPLRLDDFYKYTFGAITPNKIVNVVLFLFLVATILYLVKTIQRARVLFIYLCIITLLVPFFIFLNLKYSVWSYYWVGNPALYSLLLAYALGILVQAFDGKKKLIALTIVIVFFLIMYNPFSQLSGWKEGFIPAGSQRLSTELQVTDAIYKDAGGKPFSYYVITPPVYDYYYRYLFWWRHSTTYANAPKDQKQKQIYLIIEPNFFDATGKFFKKRTLHTDQTPVKTLHFPDGITVQKILPDPNEKPVDRNYFPQL